MFSKRPALTPFLHDRLEHIDGELTTLVLSDDTNPSQILARILNARAEIRKLIGPSNPWDGIPPALGHLPDTV